MTPSIVETWLTRRSSFVTVYCWGFLRITARKGCKQDDPTFSLYVIFLIYILLCLMLWYENFITEVIILFWYIFYIKSGLLFNLYQYCLKLKKYQIIYCFMDVVYPENPKRCYGEFCGTWRLRWTLGNTGYFITLFALRVSRIKYEIFRIRDIFTLCTYVYFFLLYFRLTSIPTLAEETVNNKFP